MKIETVRVPVIIKQKKLGPFRSVEGIMRLKAVVTLDSSDILTALEEYVKSRAPSWVREVSCKKSEVAFTISIESAEVSTMQKVPMRKLNMIAHIAFEELELES